MTGLTSLLGLMQVADSGFPSGAFAHSYGLEQLARDGFVRTPAEVERFIKSVLRQAVGPADGLAALRAHMAMTAGDVEAIVQADLALLRTKAAAELRGASLVTGRRLIEEFSQMEGAKLGEYATLVRKDRRLGLYPVAFGVIGAALGGAGAEVVAALLLVSATALFQASMRILPVSHRDVQSGLQRIRPLVASLALEIERRADSPLRAFSPIQDIAAMRHAHSPVRLFAS